MDNSYVLIVASEVGKLEHLVNERLDSWEPLGGPLAYRGGLVQAMIERKRITVTRGPEIRINGKVADNATLSESLDKVLAEMVEKYYGQ